MNPNLPFQTAQRVFRSNRYLDPSLNPTKWVDDQLPTVTLKFKGPLRRVESRSPRGTVEGSYRITGSHYDNALGTYGLRIVRRNVGVAGPINATGTIYGWHIRHSRQGTLDVLQFAASGRAEQIGDQFRPIYAMGPGTVFWGWHGDPTGAMGSQLTFYQTMEGILSYENPFE